MLHNGQWAKTDLCAAYRNWKYWVGHLKIGNVLGGLRMWDEETIDADSIPFKIETPTEQEQRLKEMAQQGVFG